MKESKHKSLLNDLPIHNNEHKLISPKINKQFKTSKLFSYRRHSYYSLPFIEIRTFNNTSYKKPKHSFNNLTTSSFGAIRYFPINKTHQNTSIYQHLNIISSLKELNTRNKNTNENCNIDYSLTNINKFLHGNLPSNTNENYGYVKYISYTKLNNKNKPKIKIEKKLKKNIPIMKDILKSNKKINNIKNYFQLTDIIKKHYEQLLLKNKIKDKQMNSSRIIHFNKKTIYENITSNIDKQISQINIQLHNNPNLFSNHKASNITYSTQHKTFLSKQNIFK